MKALRGFPAALSLLLAAACAGLPPPPEWLGGGGREPAAPAAATAADPGAAPSRALPPRGDDPPLAFPSDLGMEALATRAASKGGSGALVVKAALARVSQGAAYKGTCYSFAESVYLDAGFPEAKRGAAFSSKEGGPYADPAVIRPGDWLYFTHMYSATVGHSAIFVAWLDFGSRSALTVDHPGNGRNEPPRFRVADLYKVWGVTRPR